VRTWEETARSPEEALKTAGSLLVKVSSCGRLRVLKGVEGVGEGVEVEGVGVGV